VAALLLPHTAEPTGRMTGALIAGHLWLAAAASALLIATPVALFLCYGSIGKAVAQMARGFGLEILVAVRPGTPGATANPRIPFDQLLRQADIVSLHCPLTPQTRNLINEHSLSLMKPSAFLVNTARGALLDEAALIDALRKKRIAGAALDVISKEPPPAEHPIIVAAKELDSLIVTPHTAWSAREARERLLKEVEENIAAFLQGHDRNRVA
jgi:glycerate dehydrogenase